MSGLATVITVGPTIMSGTVVRWYASMGAAERYDEYLSASRERVIVSRADLRSAEDVTDLTADLAVAFEVVEKLRAGQDVSALATHTRAFASGVLQEVPA